MQQPKTYMGGTMRGFVKNHIAPAVSLLLVAACSTASGPTKAFEAPEQGLRIDLPGRFEVTWSGTVEQDFGGSYEVTIEDSGRTATMIFVMAPVQSGGSSISEWIKDTAFSVSNPDGFLVWYAEQGTYKYDREPEWSESQAVIGSGQTVTVLSTPPVVINGNNRHIRVAYFATADRWCVLFAYNQGKEQPLDDVWPTILQGFHLAAPTVPN